MRGEVAAERVGIGQQLRPWRTSFLSLYGRPSERSGIGSLISPTKAPRALPSRKPSTCHSPVRSRTSRAEYRSGTGMGRAPAMSHGPSSESPMARNVQAVSPGKRARRAALNRSAATENSRTGVPVHDLDLWDLHVPELAGLRQWRPNLPVDQVGRPGVPDDTARVELARPRSGRDQGVESIVQPGSRRTHGSRQASNPSNSYQRGSSSMTGFAGCLVQVIRSVDVASAIRCSDPGSGARGARVEEVPRATLLQHRAGPGGHVFPRPHGARLERRPQHLPLTKVSRDGVADRGVEVSFVLIAEGLRRLQEEEVELRAGVSDPEVPHPSVRQSQHRVNPSIRSSPRRVRTDAGR